MTALKPRALVVAIAIAVLGLLAFAGVSQGAAETGSFEFSDTFSEPVDFTGTCLGQGASGTLTHTETTVGHYTENGPPAFGFHDHGTTTDNARAEFVDGRSLVGTIVVHFNDNATHKAQFTSTEAVHGTGTLYGSDGQPLGQVGINAISHITYRDANGNYQPDPGEVTASIDRFRLSC
jgi:hypothetical protein